MFVLVYNSSKILHRALRAIIGWLPSEELEMSDSFSRYFLPTVFGRTKKELQKNIGVFNTEKGWLSFHKTYFYIIIYIIKHLTKKAITFLCKSL